MGSVCSTKSLVSPRRPASAPTRPRSQATTSRPRSAAQPKAPPILEGEAEALGGPASDAPVDAAAADASADHGGVVAATGVLAGHAVGTVEPVSGDIACLWKGPSLVTFTARQEPLAPPPRTARGEEALPVRAAHPPSVLTDLELEGLQEQARAEERALLRTRLIESSALAEAAAEVARGLQDASGAAASAGASASASASLPIETVGEHARLWPAQLFLFTLIFLYILIHRDVFTPTLYSQLLQTRVQ